LFYNTINAKSVVFSIGRGRFHTPILEITMTLRNVDPNIRLTCTQLSEHCAKHVPATDSLHLPQKSSAGKANRCAAVRGQSPFRTISFGSDQTELLPILENHNDFIKQHAKSALCK
jgi:hypothetical protein